MNDIWYIEVENEIWFYTVEGDHYLPEGKYTRRKAVFAYPKHLYNWNLICVV
jgi:hypothetical protein